MKNTFKLFYLIFLGTMLYSLILFLLVGLYSLGISFICWLFLSEFMGVFVGFMFCFSFVFKNFFIIYIFLYILMIIVMKIVCQEYMEKFQLSIDEVIDAIFLYNMLVYKNVCEGDLPNFNKWFEKNRQEYEEMEEKKTNKKNRKK